MSIARGSRIGTYEVRALLGSGGMGEVYRAVDTKLKREVALKILPPVFASDPERCARFEREARLLASLNHQNIAQIYGFEHADGVRALALELAEGITLAERLAKGPMPLAEALAAARQIVDALDAAHEHGVIHRDLKPSNVSLRADGTVKVLDFGLAEAVDGGGAQAPTMVNPQLTDVNVVLGTTAYMAPERLRGERADKRSDIWAFGCVLFEMLSGEVAFAGADAAETAGAVLRGEPDWQSLPPDTPAPLRALIESCLKQDPARRLRDIGDARLLLDVPPAAAASAPSRNVTAARVVPWAAAAALAASLAVVIWAPWRTELPVQGEPMRFTVGLGLDDPLGSTPAISPDGTRVAYRARSPSSPDAMLAVRSLADGTETVLPGTEGGYNPFFSPDGQWLAFFASDKLQKVPVDGGVPVVLADAPLGRSGSWGPNGSIVAELTPFSGLWLVPERGGAPQRLTRPSLTRHAWPQHLPGGTILYSAGTEGLLENGQIEVLPAGGAPKVVLRGGYGARYFATDGERGHLVYLNGGVMYGVAFDPARAEVLGEPVQLIDDVKSIGTQFGASFAISESGTLVYPNGRVPQAWTVAWHDGAVAETLSAPANAYYTPRVSPAGDRVVLSVDSDRGQDVYVYDILRGALTRLTFNGEGNLWPAWTPDGEHIAFTSRNEHGGSLWWTRADGTRSPVRLFAGPHSIRQIDVSPDGAYVGYTEQDPDTGSNLWVLPIDASDPDAPQAGQPLALRATSANEGVPRFSPDGRWIAYLSDEIGPYHTWVEPFPRSSGGRWQITTEREIGIPRWSTTAPELRLPRALPRDSVIIDYEVDGERFIAGNHRTAPGLPVMSAPTGFEMFDLAPDGKRVLILMSPPRQSGDAEAVTFVVNFASEVAQRVP